MESKAISRAIEAQFPDPSLHLDSPVLEEVEKLRTEFIWPLAGVLMPRMPRNCLSGPTIEFHKEARKATFGMTLEELEAEKGGEDAWENAMPALQRLAGILNDDPSGPFCLGKTPSYADFHIVGFLEWCRCLGDGIFDRVIAVDQAYKDVFDACQPWLERNDH